MLKWLTYHLTAMCCCVALTVVNYSWYKSFTVMGLSQTFFRQTKVLSFNFFLFLPLSSLSLSNWLAVDTVYLEHTNIHLPAKLSLAAEYLDLIIHGSKFLREKNHIRLSDKLEFAEDMCILLFSFSDTLYISVKFNCIYLKFLQNYLTSSK